MKLHDTEFHFKGYGNCDSRCRVRIYSVQSDPQSKFKHSLHMGDKVVILTQLEGDVGTSVTNASEIIANLVSDEHALEPLRTVWIEHYNYPGHTETFDRVTYELGLLLQYKSAKWNHITREIVADLIGEQP